MMVELEKRRTIMAEKRAKGIRIKEQTFIEERAKEQFFVEEGITPGTQVSTEGVVSASSHTGTQ